MLHRLAQLHSYVFLPKFHIHKQNWADSETTKIKVNPNKVRELMEHAVHVQGNYMGGNLTLLTTKSCFRVGGVHCRRSQNNVLIFLALAEFFCLSDNQP